MKTVLFFKASNSRASRMKLAGAGRAAKDLGFRIQTAEATAEALANIRRLTDFWHPVGVVIDCGGIDDQMRTPRTCGLPTVFISHRPRGDVPVFSVCGDSRAIVRAAAQELLALDYPDYGFVGYPESRVWSDLRGKIFGEIVALHGRGFHAFTETSTLSSMTLTRKLRKWLAGLPRPCGLFAANDFTANRVLNLCAAEGIRVPDEIAVVGVDDDETICLNAHPPLSSVLPDMERVGYEAVRTLSEIIRRPRLKPRNVETGEALMVARRASSRARIAYPENVARAVALIRDRACSGLRARDVIDAMDGSRRYAELQFRAAIGHTILDEIQTVRMERARELLNDPGRPVSAIANLCGYASVSAFCKQHRTAFGTLPRRRR